MDRLDWLDLPPTAMIRIGAGRAFAAAMDRLDWLEPPLRREAILRTADLLRAAADALPTGSPAPPSSPSEPPRD